MPPTEVVSDPVELTARARRLVGPGRRAMLGITGSPGAGKTTLASRLVSQVDAALGAGTAAHLPMDGFHLANATLDRLGRHDRKGAVDTFDGWGFVALLRRLRDEVDHEVYAPSFRRTVDEPIAGEIAVRPAPLWWWSRGTTCWWTARRGTRSGRCWTRCGSA